MMYNILKVTISRDVEDQPLQMYSYNTSVFVADIMDERKRLREMFQADRVFFIYSEMPKDEIPHS